MNSIWRAAFACAWGCAFALPLQTNADQDRPAAATEAQPSATLLPAFGAALDERELEAHRGGQQDAFFNDMQSRASISQTSTTNVMTGTNSISDGAFTNSNGFPMVIQNTGNNVIIQNSTILNLQLK